MTPLLSGLAAPSISVHDGPGGSWGEDAVRIPDNANYAVCGLCASSRSIMSFRWRKFVRFRLSNASARSRRPRFAARASRPIVPVTLRPFSSARATPRRSSMRIRSAWISQPALSPPSRLDRVPTMWLPQAIARSGVFRPMVAGGRSSSGPKGVHPDWRVRPPQRTEESLFRTIPVIFRYAKSGSDS